MVDQNQLVEDEIGDPDLILDGGDVEEDRRARSQIKGKVGKNTKIKSSTNSTIPTSIDALVPHSNVDAIDRSDEDHEVIGDPNLVSDDIEMTDSFSHLCDEAHEVIDKLGDPTLLLGHMGTPDSAPNDGLDEWFTMNDNGQLEFELPTEFNIVDNSAAVQNAILADANTRLANTVRDTPQAGPSEPFNGIHRHPSKSGDAVAGPSKIPHRSTYMRQKKRFRTKTDDDNLIRDTFGDILGGGRNVKKLLKLVQANPGLADKLLEHADDDKDSDVDGIPPIRSLALMHQAGLTLEQWNMVNKYLE